MILIDLPNIAVGDDLERDARQASSRRAIPAAMPNNLPDLVSVTAPSNNPKHHGAEPSSMMIPINPAPLLMIFDFDHPGCARSARCDGHLIAADEYGRS